MAGYTKQDRVDYYEEKPPPDDAFSTALKWQNDSTVAMVQVMLPETVVSVAQVRVVFQTHEVVIEFAHGTVVQTVRLPHPAIVPAESTWKLSKRDFTGKGVRACIHCELRKADATLWPRDTFGASLVNTTTAPPDDAVVDKAPPPKAAPRTKLVVRPPIAPPPAGVEAPETFGVRYTWAQTGETVSVWMRVPAKTKAKQVVVKSTPTTVTTILTLDDYTAEHRRRLVRHISPSETIWEFDDADDDDDDDDEPTPADRRRIRIDMQLANYAGDALTADGPFVKET